MSTVVKSDDEVKLLIKIVSDDNSIQSNSGYDEENGIDNLRNGGKSRPAMNIKQNEETIHIVSDEDSLLNEDFNGVEHLYWHENDSNSDNDFATNKSANPEDLPEKSFIIPKGFIDGMGAL